MMRRNFQKAKYSKAVLYNTNPKLGPIEAIIIKEDPESVPVGKAAMTALGCLEGIGFDIYTNTPKPLDISGSMTIRRDGRRWRVNVADEIARQLIPNPENKPRVVARNGDKGEATLANLVHSFTKRCRLGHKTKYLTVIDDLPPQGKNVYVLCKCSSCGGTISCRWDYVADVNSSNTCGCNPHGFMNIFEDEGKAIMFKYIHNQKKKLDSVWRNNEVGAINFNLWCETNGYTPGNNLKIVDRDQPIGPDNCELERI